mmetsp:Transcript_33990/g.60125  ORF Transcript_33990/g.60125 Transcript_33990/m.60125 type:complete len:253 (-) Transcript_33990:824-1582(-)
MSSSSVSQLRKRNSCQKATISSIARFFPGQTCESGLQVSLLTIALSEKINDLLLSCAFNPGRPILNFNGSGKTRSSCMDCSTFATSCLQDSPSSVTHLGTPATGGFIRIVSHMKFLIEASSLAFTFASSGGRSSSSVYHQASMFMRTVGTDRPPAYKKPVWKKLAVLASFSSSHSASGNFTLSASLMSSAWSWTLHWKKGRGVQYLNRQHSRYVMLARPTPTLPVPGNSKPQGKLRYSFASSSVMSMLVRTL